MKMTRVMVQDLRVGDQILVGYSYCNLSKRYEAHLFGIKTTAKERADYGYATGTISKIDTVRKSERIFRGNKNLWLTIDGVPDKHLLYKWQKATVVTF